ncbi:MAG: DUF2163 domain-containing protein [Pseudomonadota bacterium]
MSGDREALLTHLSTGVTTTCRAWKLERRDGQVLGFTDHDRNLVIDGVTCRAGTGLTAQALAQATGLSVDNTEAAGALSDAAVTEEDIAAGRFDGAAVTCWLVNWQDVSERIVLFRGSIGEVTRGGGAFRAELRGLSEALNQPQGRVFQKQCSAVLGDATCGVDLNAPGMFAERDVETVDEGRAFTFTSLSGFENGWFARGRFRVQTGAAAGLVGQIKVDREDASGRSIELWQSLRAEIVPGDRVRLEAGCDKRLATCRAKFSNVMNFRGFPHVPGEDWVTGYPNSTTLNDGGSYVNPQGTTS